MKGRGFANGSEAIQLMQYCMSHDSDNMVDVVRTYFILPIHTIYFLNGREASSKPNVVPTTQYSISDATWVSFINVSLKSAYNVFIYEI